MKSKVRQEIRNNDVAELKKKLIDTRKALVDAQLELAQFKLKNTSMLTNLRKEIAVILTALKEKEMNNGKNA